MSESGPRPGSGAASSGGRAEAGPELAKRVAAARQRSGLTQAELAEASGVTDETISRIERGRYEPAVSTLFRLAEALEISLDRLAGEPAREAGAAARAKAGPRRSPLVRRLHARIDVLTPDAQRALLAVAERLPETPRPPRSSR